VQTLYERHIEQDDCAGAESQLAGDHIRTPADAFCQMATNAATGLDIELGDGGSAQALRPVAWDEWITLPVRDGDYAVHTTRGAIRVSSGLLKPAFAP
jgi:hypothetical protein